MGRPDFKTTHQNWREHWITSPITRPQFLGRNDHDLRWRKKHPPINLKKDDSLFELEIAVPGFTKEHIEVSIKDNLLIISGSKAVDDANDSDFVIKEFNTDTFERVFQLANDIGHEKITATCRDGILKLRFIDVPKDEERAFKNVEVN